ncbi:MAG: dihydrodipicolinate synthetase [Chitinophagia bacterium]|nr:dihydrodipicolinate synthetase [Chitinophagia bacterium]
MKFKKLSGIIPATFTPMHPDGSLHLEAIPSYYELLIRNNISAIFICGTTGEGELLTKEERMMVAEKWLEVSSTNKQFKVIVVAGSNRIDEAIALAKHAEKNGAYGISYISPYYYKPGTIDALIECCKKVAAAVPSLPFYYYHIPILTHVKFSMIEFLQKADSQITNLAGVKYSDEDHVDYLKCLQFNNGSHDIFWGKDETLLSALSIGASAAIGSTYNYMTPLYASILDAFNVKDIVTAQNLQMKSVEVVNLLYKYTGLSTGKYMMKLLGVDCGPSRSPLSNLSSTQMKSLEEDLKSIGFSNFCMK